MASQLVDGFGRVAKKLRISITDRCNMQCVYCMPQGNNKWIDSAEVLNDEEIIRLARIFASLGIEKIRITGGEPMLRSGIEKMVSKLAKIDGIRSVSITTNGLLFGDKINQLKEAGLASVNISLDTFRRERFEAMTGVDGVARVVNCISLARNAGLEVKVNTVVIRGWNDDEVVDFAKFAVDTGLAVRFIEFMPLDGSGIWAPNLVFGKGEIIEKLRAALGEPIALGNPGSEPAQLYSIGGTGIVGFIPSITEPFCGGCDRVRITSDGRFLTCLFENPGHDVKNLLRGGKSDGEIADYIAEGMRNKPEGIAAIIRLGRLRPKLNMMHEIGG